MYLCPIFVNKTFPNFTVQNEKTLSNIKKNPSGIKSLILVSCLIHCVCFTARRRERQ